MKYCVEDKSETLYYNNMWQEAKTPADTKALQTKHVFVGGVRIASKKGYGSVSSGFERNQTYYYHGDHLGSAQLISNYAGNLHERIEYTPYGESWVEHKYPDYESTFMPFRFTGKELDEETGLYYYGARYLDPKTSRWISGDPALGEYVPQAGKGADGLAGMGGVFNYVNLHVYHYAGNNPVKYIDPDGREVDYDKRTSDIKEADAIRNQRRSIQAEATRSKMADLAKDALANNPDGWLTKEPRNASNVRYDLVFQGDRVEDGKDISGDFKCNQFFYEKAINAGADPGTLIHAKDWADPTNKGLINLGWMPLGPNETPNAWRCRGCCIP